jgi:hypothetical protein
MKFRKVIVFFLEDSNGVNAKKGYINKQSAEVGLVEHYTEAQIATGEAKIVPIEVIDYFGETKES